MEAEGETMEKVELMGMSQKPTKRIIKHVHPLW